MSPEATSFPSTPANLQNRSPVTTSAIAGIVVGSVTALILLVIIVVHVARRRNKGAIYDSESTQNEKTQDTRYNLVPAHRPTLSDAVATSPLLDAPPSFSYDLERLENYSHSQQSSHTTPRSLNNATQVHLAYDLTASSTSADSPEYHEPLLFPSPPHSSAQLCTSPEQISSAPLPQHEVSLSPIQGSNSMSHNSRPSALRDHGLGQAHQSLSTVTKTDTGPALLNFSFSRRKSGSSKPSTTTRVRQTSVAGAQTFMPSSGFRDSPSERPASTRANSAPSLNHATQTANPLRPDSLTDTGENVGSTVPRRLARRTNSEMTAQQLSISTQDWPRRTSNFGADAHGSILPRGASSRAVTATSERPTVPAGPFSNHTYSPSQQPQLYRLESPPPTPNEPLTRAFRTSIRSESTNASSTPSLGTLRHYPSITGSSATYVTAPSEAADSNDWDMFRAGLIAAKHQTRSLASRANQIREIDDLDGTLHKPVGERTLPPIRLPSTLRPGNARSSPSQLHAPLDLDAPRAAYTHKTTVSSPAALPPALRAGGGNRLSLQVNATTPHPYALQPGSVVATEPRPHRAHLRTSEALRVRTEPRVPRSSRLRVKSSSSAIMES